MADWLQQEQTHPLATAVQLPLPEGLIVQPNCKPKWDWALLKSLYFSLQQVCLLVDIRSEIQLNLLRHYIFVLHSCNPQSREKKKQFKHVFLSTFQCPKVELAAGFFQFFAFLAKIYHLFLNNRKLIKKCS